MTYVKDKPKLSKLHDPVTFNGQSTLSLAELHKLLHRDRKSPLTMDDDLMEFLTGIPDEELSEKDLPINKIVKV